MGDIPEGLWETADSSFSLRSHLQGQQHISWQEEAPLLWHEGQLCPAVSPWSRAGGRGWYCVLSCITIVCNLSQCPQAKMPGYACSTCLTPAVEVWLWAPLEVSHWVSRHEPSHSRMNKSSWGLVSSGHVWFLIEYFSLLWKFLNVTNIKECICKTSTTTTVKLIKWAAPLKKHFGSKAWPNLKHHENLTLHEKTTRLDQTEPGRLLGRIKISSGLSESVDCSHEPESAQVMRLRVFSY